MWLSRLRSEGIHQPSLNRRLAISGSRLVNWGRRPRDPAAPMKESTTRCSTRRRLSFVKSERDSRASESHRFVLFFVVMILPQVHLRKPCYDFTFL